MCVLFACKSKQLIESKNKTIVSTDVKLDTKESQLITDKSYLESLINEHNLLIEIEEVFESSKDSTKQILKSRKTIISEQKKETKNTQQNNIAESIKKESSMNKEVDSTSIIKNRSKQVKTESGAPFSIIAGIVFIIIGVSWIVYNIKKSK